MKRLIACFALAALLISAAIAGSPRSHIDELSGQFVAAFNAGDGAALAGLYSENAALFPPGGDRVSGRAAIQAFWQGVLDSGIKLDELNTVEVDARGDLASEVGSLVLSAPGDDGTVKIVGQYIVVWKRSGHTWQLHRDIWNTK